jgi:hypothetical protein
MIEIHSGNFHSEILGCILVGDKFKDINKDGQLDVANSKKTMVALFDMMPDKFKLEIAVR